jgi:hypothetical protein
MLFKLKSTSATYQWGIQWCLHSQLGHNTEAYIDNVVVKTQEDEGLISNLAKTFDNLRKFKLSWTLRSVHSVRPRENYSGIWSPIVVSTLTQRRYRLSPK